MHSVVTSFSPLGWKQYGQEFVDSFYQLFPPEVRLLSYWEFERPAYGGLLPGYDLFSIEPSASFLARHNANDIIRGRKPGRMPWGRKAREEGYSYRHDAYKFARKVFAVAHAARKLEHGRLFWIDADVLVEKRVEASLLVKLLPEETSLCYLGRRLAHSELGFVGYNLDRLETHAFIAAYEREYAEDRFLQRAYWDDCSVFDALVHELKPTVKKIEHTSHRQPFDNSILGEYMTHRKGKRKPSNDS